MDAEYLKKYEPFFGSWYIKRKLGEGGYGTVFEIERQEFGRVYTAALKALTIPRTEGELKSAISEGMSKEQAEAYFGGIVRDMTNEFALMDRLKGNSYIVSYEDHAVIPHETGIGWDILMRMELLTPLSDYLKDHTMSEAEVAKLGIDICHALELCDANQIIHRDIKPDNIFFSPAGTFKLGDFGVARVAERTSGASTRIGTGSYIAPETYAGARYTNKVDLYALGLVLYRLLNDNRLPFMPPATEPITYQDKEEAQAKRIAGKPLPAPVHASPAMAEVILKACAFQPELRFENAGEMCRALEQLPHAEAKPVMQYADSDDKTVLLFEPAEEEIQQLQRAPENVRSTKPDAVKSNHNRNPKARKKKQKKSPAALIAVICVLAAVCIVLAVVLITRNGSGSGTNGSKESLSAADLETETARQAGIVSESTQATHTHVFYLILADDDAEKAAWIGEIRSDLSRIDEAIDRLKELYPDDGFVYRAVENATPELKESAEYLIQEKESGADIHDMYMAFEVNYIYPASKMNDAVNELYAQSDTVVYLPEDMVNAYELRAKAYSLEKNLLYAVAAEETDVARQRIEAAAYDASNVSELLKALNETGYKPDVIQEAVSVCEEINSAYSGFEAQMEGMTAVEQEALFRQRLAEPFLRLHQVLSQLDD